MRRAERARRNERLSAVEQSGHAMNLGGLDRFLDRHWRNNCGDAFGQH